MKRERIVHGYCFTCTEIVDDCGLPIIKLCKLHSASPKLLLACKAAKIELSSDDLYQNNKETYDALDSAINKAEGI